MTPYIPRAPGFTTSIERLKSNRWNESLAQCFEEGSIATKPATLPGTSAKKIRVGRFLPRQRPRSPNRQASRDRRRRLGGSSALPDTLRHYYTEGQRAVLCIIAGEIKHHGVCDLPIDKIAALAGVCRTTVQTTLHEGRRLLHLKVTERPRQGGKHLTNLVEIISTDWRAWIKRAPSVHRPIGSKSVRMVSTTKSIVRSKKEALRAARGDSHEESEALARGVTQMRIEVPAMCRVQVNQKPKRE